MSRGRVALAAGMAGLAVLAGCGTPGGTAAPAAPSVEGGAFGAGAAQVADPASLARGSSQATRDAGSARFAVTLSSATTGPGAEGFPSINVTSEGSYDFAGKIGQSTDVASGEGIPEIRSMSIFAADAFYTQPEGATQWYKIDYAELGGPTAGQQQDPAQQLELLTGAADDVQEAGPADVRGTPTRRLTLTIDPERFAGQSGANEQTAKLLAGVEPFPAEVYVDADGRVRRFDFTLALPGSALAASVPEAANNPELLAQLSALTSTSEVSIEYFDFGVEVDVALPDPGQVTEGLPGPTA